jgi:sugar O-acyltransferase (sialic acid O-acetyltransferase NeuD family)
VRTRQVFVYGAGGHGKVVADILISEGEIGFAGFIDDREELLGTKVMGFPVLGNAEWLREQASRSRLALALGTGENGVRQVLMTRCSEWGIEVLTLVHPAATVARSASLGEGTVVMAGARVNPEANVGAGVIVNTGAVVEHDARIGDFAHVAPNAAMGGASRLGTFSHLGLGAAVLEGVTIGRHTIVGAGAVVVRDLPDHVVAIGVPARIHRQLDHEDVPVNVVGSSE